MNVLFMPQTCDLGPSSRYRVYQLLPHLNKMGIETTVSPGVEERLYRQLYLKGRGSRVEAFRAVRQKRNADLERARVFDAVFVQKGLFPGLTSRLERKLAERLPLVFDFDDAIWLPREGGNPLLRGLHRERTVQQILEVATAILAGNSFLADYARQFNDHVTVVPSAVDLARYQWHGYPAHVSRMSQPHGQDAHATPIVGWIGSRSTLGYLKSLRVVFEKLGITPRIIASGDVSGLGFPVEFRQWTLETEIAELTQLDIGLAPLPDTPWERGKCGVKLLQYMACGIPAVASPVGVHIEIIHDGVNGFLARNEAEWHDRLALLMADHALRRRLGDAARQTVEQSYDLPKIAARVATVLLNCRQNSSGEHADKRHDRQVES